MDLNINVSGSSTHSSVYYKGDDFGFLIVNFPWLSSDVPRLTSYVFINSDHKRIQECSISVKGRVICNQRCLESDQPGV